MGSRGQTQASALKADSPLSGLPGKLTHHANPPLKVNDSVAYATPARLWSRHCPVPKHLCVPKEASWAAEQSRPLPSLSPVQFSSAAPSCPTLCDPMNRSAPGLPVHHHLPEFTQTHVHRVHDATQPSHPLSSPSPPAPNPSQQKSLF